jgi:RpiR family carbohydrate utilization transcriptional regulator
MLLDSIRNRLDTLSKSEHKVALAVLAKPELTIAENISALARLAQVSEPTVVRFCRTLGLDGWHEFKLKLAQSLALAPKLSDSAMRQDDLMVDLVDKICNRSVNALLDLRSSLNVHRVEQALAVLSRATKIEFYGQGSSGIIAMDAQHKFFRSGVPTVAYSDPHIHSISAALLKPGDVVVAISQRGHNTALLRSVMLAKKAGAAVVVLAPSGTPLSEAATVPVDIDLAFETDPYTPITARLAYLVVIDILAVGLALQKGPAFRRKMLHAQKALQKIDMELDSFLQHPSR